MLVVFGGLPGVGKSTLASRLARELRAMYLRIDTLEQWIRNAGFGDGDMGPMGYMVAYELACENLKLGLSVVSDSVNPLAITRAAWRRVAERAKVDVIGVEVLCSSRAEHRQRVETRATDVQGLVLPTWQQVLDREYEPWHADVVIDTSGRTPDESFTELRRRVAALER